MRIEQTPLKDCFIVHEKVHGDARGYFIETFNQRDFNAGSGLDILFVQDNQSRSSKGGIKRASYAKRCFCTSKAGKGFRRFGT